MSTATPRPHRPSSARSGPPQEPQRRPGPTGILLVSPDAVLLLAVVILYPLVKAVFMSFQKDSGLDKATGMFVEGGFAGLPNYRHWLLQQCQTPTGVTSLPARQPRLAVLRRALRHPLLHGHHRGHRDRASACGSP